MVPTTVNADAEFTASAFAYLRDLEYTAQVTKARRQTLLGSREHDSARRAGPSATDTPGGAMRSPADVLDERWDVLLAEARRRTERDVAYIAGWYARAAIIACRAVLADEEINAAWLEFKTLHDDLGKPIEEDPRSPAFRPELPEIGELRTGHAHVDMRVQEAQKPLQAAYEAAATAAHWNAERERRAAEGDPGVGEPTGLAGWEADQAVKANEFAAEIPDLLIAWATAVTNAADYARHHRNDTRSREIAALRLTDA